MDSKEKIKLALGHQRARAAGYRPDADHRNSRLGQKNCANITSWKKRLPVIIEPYQMLGMAETICGKRSASIPSRSGINGRCLVSRTRTSRRKWTTPWGQDVLVGKEFVTTESADKVFIYAGGDTGYPPAGEMPKSSFFFDTVIRQPPFDDDDLNPDDNLEEFGEISEDDLQYFAVMNEELKDSKYLVGGNLGARDRRHRDGHRTDAEGAQGHS